jgi:hypothetical protein
LRSPAAPHGLSAAPPDLAVGDALVLRREPQNRYDGFAIAVHRRDGTKLGYIPRGANQTLARLMDAGWRTDAAIAGLGNRASLADIAFTSVAEGDPSVRVTLSRHRRT